MLRVLATVLFSLSFVGSTTVWANDCYPHCDWNHDFGPYDFTYKRSDLFAYPIYGPRQECSPYLRYVYQRGYPFEKESLFDHRQGQLLFPSDSDLQAQGGVGRQEFA